MHGWLPINIKTGMLLDGDDVQVCVCVHVSCYVCVCVCLAVSAYEKFGYIFPGVEVQNL